MQTHKLQVQRTARYYSLGAAPEQCKQLWVVCHGYGQLAAYFLRHFEAICPEDTCIVAPEALSRFYWNLANDRVGASWMTKEARIEEIEDYVAYLNQLLTLLSQSTQQPRIGVLGFSQGCATVCRWLQAGAFRAQRLVLCSGTFPDDLPEAAFAQGQGGQTTDIQVVYGTQDSFYTTEQFQEHLQKVRAKGIDFQQTSFEGGHELNIEILERLLKIPL